MILNHDVMIILFLIGHNEKKKIYIANSAWWDKGLMSLLFDYKELTI